MKKIFLALFLCVSAISAQTPTPNIGLQIPATGSNNWYIPLNYNFTKLDLLLGGVSPVPQFRITGNLYVGGVVQAAGFVGLSGAFATTPGAAQGAVPYFSGSGTGTTISGVTFTGIPYFAPNAAPRSITNADLGTILAGATNCSISGTYYSPSGNTCGTGGYFSGTSTVTVNGTPAAGLVLMATSASTANWVQLTPANIAPAFTASLACTTNVLCNTVEVGTSTISPAGFTASYANPTLPTSATISDGTNTTTLSTPFTSGSLAASYCTVSQGTTSFTFTLSSSGNGQTATSARTEYCLPRTFAGGGTGTATSASSSGTSAILTGGGASGTLTSQGLQLTYVGQSFTLNLSAQYPYLLLTGGCSHTFTVNGLPTAFTCTTVNFSNQNGATISGMGLYQGPATLTGSAVIVQVVSL